MILTEEQKRVITECSWRDIEGIIASFLTGRLKELDKEFVKDLYDTLKSKHLIIETPKD